MLIGILKIFIIIKRLITAFFNIFIYRIIRIFFSFIFYNIIVKIYRLYFYILKKTGLSKVKSRIEFYTKLISSQKMIHIFVAFITIILVFTNYASRAKAQPEDITRGTILSTLIENEFNTPEEEQLVEETFDAEEFISPLQQKYLDNLSMKNNYYISQPGVDNFIDDSTSMNDDNSAIIKPDMTSTNEERPEDLPVIRRSEIVYHEVADGETISTIARRYGITVNTILWENNLTAYSIIRPGDKLTILPVSGVTYSVVSGDTLSKIAKNYNISEDEIIKANNIGNYLQKGQKIIIPGGKKINNQYASRNTYQSISGLSAIKDIIKDVPMSAKPSSGNKMNWPTVGRRLTQYYSARHTAVDIANKVGTPIYAADTGVIESIGWGTGYGNNIVINHGGGKKTRYAHLSKFYVKRGQEVDKGQVIGAMGSTGWSTGPHLHFEVIINNRKYNPLSYIK